MLERGTQLISINGSKLTIESELGKGGQGSVYHVRTGDGQHAAVKWYAPEFQDPSFRSNIEALVEMDPPSKHFLWPQDVIERDGEFGYLMAMRPCEYANIPRLLRRDVVPSPRNLLHTALQTVSGFRALQARGLFYCDISDSNLFFNPTNGDVLICDNDNVVAPGEVPPVVGTPRFMAPEIVREEAEPSPLSDKFSLAVLLFMLLCNHHPLEGAVSARIRVLDLRAMRMIFGTKPVFIFDPDDASNRPVRGLHDNAWEFWDFYPQCLRDVFTKAFTDGLTVEGRPSFSEWQMALTQAEDSVLTCSCGGQNLHDFAAGQQRSCWACGGKLTLPVHLEVGRRKILLDRDTKLFAHHLTGRGDPGDRGDPLAEMVKHPKRDACGLRNLSAQTWYVKRPDRTAVVIQPRQSIVLSPGTAISFGECDGTVQA